ncbi:MAG: cobalamin B12-binding domain-containing protein, partial [Candidatus Verstraetearchaeota archaeon]|nr:cobalamin B12-binding domain-containing protein [Candidatus Verstraetearchaeota archaeon]
MDIETISVLGLRAPPLGLAYIAAVLEKEGYDVDIIDATALGLSFKELGNELKKRNPDVIGVTSITPTIYDAMKTIDIAKEYCPNAITVMGG